MTREAYENVKDQIGGCGIWCGSCAVGNGAIREIAERFKQILDSHGVEHWAPDEVDYPAFARGLTAVRKIAACAGCRQGGGRDDCRLRACSVENELADCSDCSEFGACPSHELLQHMREGARKAGLFVREPGENPAQLLAAWTKRVQSAWPSSILFLEER